VNFFQAGYYNFIVKVRILLPRIKRLAQIGIILSSLFILLGSSNLPPSDKVETFRAFTRNIEFDYVTWTLDALYSKAEQVSLDIPRYLSAPDQKDLVISYMNLVQLLAQINYQIETIYADPNTTNAEVETAALKSERNRVTDTISLVSPLVEKVVQDQASSIIAGYGLGLEGQPIPPVVYAVTSTPQALIISPRNVIRQDADISLRSDLTIEQIIALEQEIETSHQVSALVIKTGGIGLYPSMITRTTDLNWMLETICHEWTHNFLTLRPLGINYDASPELRTMNETTANIAGKEISQRILERYYPEFLLEKSLPGSQADLPEEAEKTPVFDFRREMHQTRITVDEMLANGIITGAEEYMEKRRQLFWENGYQIRRLNQAYFAFHGAYADEPDGAAGMDPVGPAVQTLRQNSRNLAEFLNRISWMTSFDQLRVTVGQ